MNKNLCFYFQVHQPYRLSEVSIFEIGLDKKLFHGPERARNEAIFKKVANKCYIPANATFLELLKKHPEMKICFSLSGVFLEQCLEFGDLGQEVLNSFKALVDTGQVELLAETYYHSLAALQSEEEFIKQVDLHAELIQELFNVKPQVFRNTELIYNNAIGKKVHELGYKGILLEGWDPILDGRSPNHVYRVPNWVIENKEESQENFGMLLKNYKLSDDIAFRFSDKNWTEHPLSVEKFLGWAKNNVGENLNLFMDYETFGEHQWEESGIFEFLKALPSACKRDGIGFMTPSEVLQMSRHFEELDVHHPISWADSERDLSAWLGNEMQNSSMKRVYQLEEQVHETGCGEILNSWRKLQTSDHFYYMCTKFWSDGDVHKYFSPYESPYEAFIHYNNALSDLEHQISRLLPSSQQS
jgi:alpha-amylase